MRGGSTSDREQVQWAGKFDLFRNQSFAKFQLSENEKRPPAEKICLQNGFLVTSPHTQS
jgi:hypothetical protein